MANDGTVIITPQNRDEAIAWYQDVINLGKIDTLTPQGKIIAQNLISQGLVKTKTPQKKYSPMGAVEGTISKFGTGASFGFAPKIYGALQSALPYPYGSGQSYKESVADYRGSMDEYAKKYPKTALTSELLGSVTTGLGGAGATQQALKHVPKVQKFVADKWSPLNALTKGAAYGAGGGAVFGAGYSDVGEELQGAAEGTLWGIGLGAGSVPVLKLGGKALNLTGTALGAAWATMSNPMKKAMDDLIIALRDDGVDPARIGEILETLGDDAVIGDVGGGNVIALVDQMHIHSGKARSLLEKLLTDRQSRQGDKIKEIVKKYLKQDEITIDDLRAIEQARKTQARPFYEKVKDIPLSGVSEELDKLILKLYRGNKSAFKKAKQFAELGEEDVLFNTIVQRSMKTGKDEIIPSGYTVQDINLLKQGIDDLIGSALNSGNKGLASNLIRIKNSMLDIVDEVAPDYKTARKIYSNSISVQNSAEMGRKILRQDWDVVEDFFKHASDADKDHFKMGAIRAIRDKIDDIVDLGDRGRLFSKESVRKRITPMFDDASELDAFMVDIGNEIRKARTLSVRGGSQTAGRQMVEKELLKQRDLKTKIFDALSADSSKDKLVNEELSKLLLSQDKNVIENTKKLIEKRARNNIFQRTKQNLQPTLGLLAPTSPFVIGGQPQTDLPQGLLDLF